MKTVMEEALKVIMDNTSILLIGLTGMEEEIARIVESMIETV